MARRHLPADGAIRLSVAPGADGHTWLAVVGLSSSVFSYQLSVSSRQSPVCSLQSPVSSRQSPVGNQSPITNIQSSVVRHQSPIISPRPSVFSHSHQSLVSNPPPVRREPFVGLGSTLWSAVRSDADLRSQPAAARSSAPGQLVSSRRPPPSERQLARLAALGELSESKAAPTRPAVSTRPRGEHESRPDPVRVITSRPLRPKVLQTEHTHSAGGAVISQAVLTPHNTAVCTREQWRVTRHPLRSGVGWPCYSPSHKPSRWQGNTKTAPLVNGGV